MHEEEKRKCQRCKRYARAEDFVRINGHTLCNDCSYDYGDYLYDKNKDDRMMKELNDDL